MATHGPCKRAVSHVHVNQKIRMVTYLFDVQYIRHNIQLCKQPQFNIETTQNDNNNMEIALFG